MYVQLICLVILGSQSLNLCLHRKEENIEYLMLKHSYIIIMGGIQNYGTKYITQILVLTFCDV